MKFWRVTSKFIHVQDCLTLEKAERLAERIRTRKWFRGTSEITEGVIERDYPHFDTEDLQTIRTNPIYFDNIGHLLPQLESGRADASACARLWE